MYYICNQNHLKACYEYDDDEIFNKHLYILYESYYQLYFIKQCNDFFNPLPRLLDFKSWFDNKCITTSSNTVCFSLCSLNLSFACLVIFYSFSPSLMRTRCFSCSSQKQPLGGGVVKFSRRSWFLLTSVRSSTSNHLLSPVTDVTDQLILMFLQTFHTKPSKSVIISVYKG